MQTRFGIIPTEELNLLDIPTFPQTNLPNFLSKLTIESIDSDSSFIKLASADNKMILSEDPTAFKKARYFSFGSSKAVELPRVLNPQLAYLLGYMIGDGYLKDVSKSYATSGKFEHKITVCDEFKIQMRRIQKLYKILFSLDLPLRERQSKGEALYYLNPTNKVIHRFFTQVFELPSGRKTGKLKVPELIKTAPRKIQKWFIKGVFDSDGGTRAAEKASISQPMVKLKMCSPKFVESIKSFIELLFDISVNGPYWDKSSDSSFIQIERKHDIEKLNREKIFSHPVKEWRLRKICSMGR